jgi:hypothetical protein
MRGSDDRSGSLFSYVDLEARVSAGSSATDDPRDSERGVGRSDEGIWGALSTAVGATVDCAGAAVAGDAAADDDKGLTPDAKKLSQIEGDASGVLIEIPGNGGTQFLSIRRECLRSR